MVESLWIERDRASSQQEEQEVEIEAEQELKLCQPLVKIRSLANVNPFSSFGFWVSKSLQNLSCRAQLPNGFILRRLLCLGLVVKILVSCCSSAGSIEAGEVGMKCLVEKSDGIEERKDGFNANGGENKSFTNSIGRAALML